MIERTAATILVHIRSLGFIVSVHHMDGTAISMDPAGPTVHHGKGYVEIHAIGLVEPCPQHIARVEGEGPEAEYRAASELARMVGVNAQAC